MRDEGKKEIQLFDPIWAPAEGTEDSAKVPMTAAATRSMRSLRGSLPCSDTEINKRRSWKPLAAIDAAAVTLFSVPITSMTDISGRRDAMISSSAAANERSPPRRPPSRSSPG